MSERERGAVVVNSLLLSVFNVRDKKLNKAIKTNRTSASFGYFFYQSFMCHVTSGHVTSHLCVTFPCCLCWNYTSVASILLNSTIQRQFNPKNGSPGRLTCEVFEKKIRTWPEEREKLQKLFIVEDVPSQAVSLREAVRSSSIGLGQGFFKCTCTTGCNSIKEV